MANPVITNLIKTGAIIYYAPEGEAEPDETSIDAGVAWGGNWARVGYTKAPLASLYEFEEFDIEVEELLGPVKRRKTKENITLETVLAELEADYWSLVADGTVVDTAAGGSQKAFESLEIGDVAIRTVRHWGFEGQYVDSAGATQPIRVFLPRATSNINGAMEFSKRTDDYSGIPIQIKGLVNTTNNNEMFKWQRVTGATT
jgi:hypothetical protein